MIAENTYTKEWVEAIVKQTVAETIDSISNLDNGDILFSGLEREENMSSNNRKIRRPIVLNGARVWVTGNTEQEYAENLLRLAGCQQTTVPRGRHLFREYADHWFETFSKPNIAKVTILTYERQLRLYIYPVIGDLFLEDITVSDVQKVFNRMGDDKKQTTKTKVKLVLSQIFKMAYEEQIIDRNPMQSMSLKIKGTASDPTKPYSVEQMKYLAAHLNDISDPTRRAWLALSIALPLRPEEVLGLKWKDLDRENCILHIRNTVTHPSRGEPYFRPYTKTAFSKRDLQFSPEILNYIPDNGADDEFIIGGKEPINYGTYRGMIKWIAKEIGFDETIVPRRFRTTVATDISAMTHDIKLVQKMLGHTTPQMTLRYYDKGRSQTSDASEAISKCYGFDSN